MRSQPQRSQCDPRELEAALPDSVATQRLYRALGDYRSRYSRGHAEAVREIMAAIRDYVVEMKASQMDSAVVIVSLKALLAEFPATALLHPVAIRKCIEFYYDSSIVAARA